MKRISILPALVFILIISVTAKTEIIPEAEQYFQKANELLKRMDYEGAIAEYSKVINLSSDSKIAQDAQYWIGQSHLKAGRFDDAKATFAKLIEQYPASAIVPVTKLMVERVEQAKKIEKKRKAMSNTADKGFIIDPGTGIKYTKMASFSGKNDVIEDTTYPTRRGCLELSPNGKFLLYKKLVVPLDGSEPFDLVDIPATLCIWSPDGRSVAFNSEGAIWVIPVSPQTARPTGPAKKLHDGNYRFRAKLSWSPDSKKLVFSRPPDRIQRIPGGDVWCLSVKDGSLRRITSDPAREGAPVWSPDGKTIAYGMKEDRYKNRYHLCLISAEGSTPRKIMELGQRIVPLWFPDGKWIVSKLSDKIRLFDLHDDRQLELIPPDVVGDFFSMSPDGKKMFFYQPSYGYKYDIKVVSASGGPPFDLGRQITLYPEHLWTPDSKMIISQGGNQDGRYGVWISPLSGSEPVFLEMDVSVEDKPLKIIAISPNAQKLAFSVDRDDGTEELYVVSISLQEARTKGSDVKVFEGLYRGISGTNVTTSWSPDGSKIAVIHRGNVWIAYSNGDKPVQITKTPEMEIWPGWSPDGDKICYMSGGDLYVRPVSGGKATKIPGADRTSAWSPDSKRLVIQSEGTISVVSVADNETQQIAELNDLGLERVFYFSWSTDGKYIACVGKHIEKGDAGPVFVIPAEGGEATTLATNDNSYKYLLHWSPDGRWISYNSEGSVKVRPEGTLWEADFEEILAKASR